MAFMLSGGGIGAFRAYKAAKQGLSFVERKILKRSIIGFFKGAIGGYLLGRAGKYISEAAHVASKFSLERRFDRTRVGRAIDRAITRAEKWLLRRIGY
jgi:hypothetical protein